MKNNEKRLALSDQQKSKIICDRVGIKLLHQIIKEQHNVGDLRETAVVCKCNPEKSIHKDYYDEFHRNPNLFTPDGQKVLAGALVNEEVEIVTDFLAYLKRKNPYASFNKNTDCMGFYWLTIIAENKLAGLFYEFIQTEER